VSQIVLLLWLRWKLTAAMVRTPGQRIAAAFMVFFIGIPLAAGAAIAVGVLLFTLRGEGKRDLMVELVRYVLAIVYIMWLTLPLLGFSQNESYDLTRALTYPISARRLTAAAFLGGFLDPWALLAMPTLLVIVIAFSSSLTSTLIVLGAIGLFMFHTIGLSQTINHAILGFLQSRRFRDIATVVIPAIVLGFYLLQQAGMRGIGHVDPEQFLRGGHSKFLSFLPTNLFTLAVGSAAHRPLIALGWTVGGLACAVATVALGAWMIERLYDGSLDTSSPRARRIPTHERESRPGFISRTLPPDFAAVLAKEFRYFWRHPVVKSQLIGVLYMVGIWAVSTWGARGASDVMPPGAIAFTSMAMMVGIFFTEAQIAFNIFGVDGAAVAALFLLPARRRRIVAAKATYVAIVMLCINTALVPVGCLIMRSFDVLIPMLTYVILASLVYAGAGCVISAYFPMPVVAWFGRRMGSRRARMGCGRSAIYLLAGAAVLLGTAPVAAAAFVPHLIGHPIWLGVTVPIGAAYGVAVFAASIVIGSSLVSSREPEIADAVSPRADQ
jgi:hypothetical protein